MLTHVYILIATTKGGNKSNKKMINIPAEQTWEKKISGCEGECCKQTA